MEEKPLSSYEPGYAAGRTLYRDGALQTPEACERDLAVRVAAWSTGQFKRHPEATVTFHVACQQFFEQGFRDGYWGRNRRPSLMNAAA